MCVAIDDYMLTRRVCRLLFREREREATQALLQDRDQQAAQKERELEEMMAMLLEEERARNDAAHRAMYELLVVSFFCILAKSCT